MSWSLIHADVLTGLASLRTGSVHQVVTSPPYYGLRDYHGVPETVWPDGWRGKLGLEPDPELYVEHLVEICRELRRVLRPDGTLWLNLGDKYGGGGSGGEGATSTLGGTRRSVIQASAAMASRRHRIGTQGNLQSIPHRVAHALQEDGWCLRSTIVWAKPCPMPESITGWRWERCRVKISKAKTALVDPSGGIDDPVKMWGPEGIGDPIHNAKWADCPGCPKCESNARPCPCCCERDAAEVQRLIFQLENTDDRRLYIELAAEYMFGNLDTCPICGGSATYGGDRLHRGRWRPTTAHEYVFLLSPGPGPYFGDGEAAREESATNDRRKPYAPGTVDHRGNGHDRGGGSIRKSTGAGSSRNPRTVWEIGPEPYQGAHYASYPTELPRRCIQAGSSPAVCAKCGAPHAPVVERREVNHRPESAHVPGNVSTKVDSTGWEPTTGGVLGYRPTCQCNAGEARAVVLDPFAGTGTTGVVALQLGRRFIGIDLSLPYLIQDARTRVGAADPETVLARAPRMPEISGPLFGGELL